MGMNPDPVGKPPPAVTTPTHGAKSKFYDMSEMVVDGEIKTPTALYTDAREKAKFDRLCSLKKSFLPVLLKERPPRF